MGPGGVPRPRADGARRLPRRAGERLAPLGADAARLLAEARASVSGGKRFRAAFCYWGFHAVAGRRRATPTSALVRACAALELLHASALVHDDYMDASDTRRGRPATHRGFDAEHRGGRLARRPRAVRRLRGDPARRPAAQLVRRAAPHAAACRWTGSWRRSTCFDRCRSEVITGQFLDVSVQARGAADVDAAMTVLRYKSAKYSVERPLHIGATLAGGTEHQLAQLGAFGLPLGEAFQLRDDLLGRLRRPVDDRQAGRRRPDRGQAHGARRAGARRRAGGCRGQRLDAALGTPLDAEQVERCGGSDRRLRAPTPRSRTVIGRSPTGRPPPCATADIDDRARGVLLELATAVTERRH